MDQALFYFSLFFFLLWCKKSVSEVANRQKVSPEMNRPYKTCRYKPKDLQIFSSGSLNFSCNHLQPASLLNPEGSSCSLFCLHPSSHPCLPLVFWPASHILLLLLLCCIIITYEYVIINENRIKPCVFYVEVFEIASLNYFCQITRLKLRFDPL